MQENNLRERLQGSILLSRNPNRENPEKFIIKEFVGEGGSTICYNAIRIIPNGTKRLGKLKEFYPVDGSFERSSFFDLHRLENGQLVPGIGTGRVFKSLCDKYLAKYKLLSDVIIKDDSAEILKNYIQNGEILYGCEKDSTVYIWSDGVAGKCFDTYLEEVKACPNTNSEENLKNILTACLEFVDCIKLLHSNGLLHLDIKPSNFLVEYSSDFKIKSGKISLFDISTLYEYKSRTFPITGSKGFMAPEIKAGMRYNNKADIYSIGAMLFNSLVVVDEIPDGLYDDKYYPEISKFVKSSKLLMNSEINSDDQLLSAICSILEKCLNKSRKKRYSAISLVKSDLEKVIKRLDMLINSSVDVVKEVKLHPINVIQKMLYQYPVYNFTKDTDFNFLVIGSGVYAHKFIDTSLQIIQMDGYHLNITAAMNDAVDGKTSYLRFRPGLEEFVNVNHHMEDESQAFANLDFVSFNDVCDEEITRIQAKNRTLIRDFFEKEGKEFHYIFVAMLEENVNREVAKTIAEIVDKKYPVFYLTQEYVGREVEDKPFGITPIFTNKTTEIEEIDKDLQDMAFNTHMSWNSFVDFDIEKMRREFLYNPENTYNKNSSITYALSVQYKLHSIDIDCSDKEKAAKEFQALLLDDTAKSIYNRLVYFEHRRWILEKVVDGWQAPRDEYGNLDFNRCIEFSKVKDDKKKLHPCIVRGSVETPLSSKEYTMDGHQKWDEEIDPSLDELDTMSIQLHQVLKKYAQDFKNNYNHSDLEKIKSFIPRDNTQIVQALQQFEFCLTNILNGVKSYCRQFDYYKEKVEKAIKVLPEITQSDIQKCLDNIKHIFFPICESQLYRNYKSYDEDLINKIPYILTNKFYTDLAIVFEDANNNQMLFQNVASSIILYPNTLHFMYVVKDEMNMEQFITSCKHVLNFLKSRKSDTEIHFVLCIPEDVCQETRSNLDVQLKNLPKQIKDSQKKIKFEYHVLKCKNNKDAMFKFKSYMKYNSISLMDVSQSLFSLTEENDEFLRTIESCGIKHFQLDASDKKFKNMQSCQVLQYIENNAFIRVSDLFVLADDESHSYQLPELSSEYEDLWKLYTGNSELEFEKNVNRWNSLCQKLLQYEEDRGYIAKIQFRDGKTTQKHWSRLMPSAAYETINTLVQKLKQVNVIDETSNVIFTSKDTCKVIIDLDESYVQDIRQLFNNQIIFFPWSNIKVERNKSWIYIFYDDLNVNDLELDEEDGLYELLYDLDDSGYINQLNIESGIVQFSYSSPRIKNILTSYAELLKIFIYYETLKLGYFDDIVCNFTCGNERVVDLIFIKEFKSIFLECDTIDIFDPNEYTWLLELNRNVGIDSQTIFLGRENGSEINVNSNFKLISNPKDIMDIGNTFVKIMKSL